MSNGDYNNRRKIYNFIIDGKSDGKFIAKELGIGVPCVKLHKTNIYRHYKVKNSTELVSKHYQSIIEALNKRIAELESADIRSMELKISQYETKLAYLESLPTLPTLFRGKVV